ncbi:hypothetical protein E3N88_18464 [Mikania micrantha]|uniref:Reverse transcriptase domain-containing protein n=1 Tax=Mikania micrantha TaxID=192012 RepID=A0A5N6NN83_9ASTR|nr:hypothetical protein E3N88_18464 [Mikania micrantha]
MDNIFLKYDFCLVYIDDILVASETIQEHEKHLQQAKTVRETELRIVRNCETKENFKVWNFGLVAVRDYVVEDPSRYAMDQKYLKTSENLRGIVSTSSDRCFAVKTPSD